MTPPPCVACQQPVSRAKMKYPGRRGLRLIEGVIWNWFCGRGCAGTEQGRANIANNLAHRADAHRAWVSAKRVDSWKDELDVLRRYHMPRDLAIGILGRIYRKGQTNAYVRRHRIQRKAAA
jgi:hypothetical protein